MTDRLASPSSLEHYQLNPRSVMAERSLAPKKARAASRALHWGGNPQEEAPQTQCQGTATEIHPSAQVCFGAGHPRGYRWADSPKDRP